MHPEVKIYAHIWDKMNSYKLLILSFIGATGIFLYSGCSSSTNSIRYNSPSVSSDSQNSAVRFSADDNKQVNSADTTCINVLDDQDVDDLPDDEPIIDISTVLKKYNSSNNSTDLSADNSNLKEKILMEIIKYLNTPYKYGGTTKSGIDCSAFTQTIYNNSLSIDLLRTAREQFTEGLTVSDIDNLEFGDLVFFNTRRRVKPGHVGIYIGDHLFAHASSKHGVIVSSLDDGYYHRRFMGGRRVDNLLSSHTASGGE